MEKTLWNHPDANSAESSEFKINVNTAVSLEDVDNMDDDDTSPDETFQNRFDPTKINIIVSQPTIYNLVQRMSVDPPEIDMNTSFQRHAELWDNTRKSRLIESLLLRIPLPTFYFDGSEENHWLIVDGLQRLNAFKSFIIDKDLKLINLEYFHEYNGCKFDDLPKNMIRRIEETQIIANIIQPGTPDEVKFTIFKRINTGGFNLNSQEIRHAIYHGEVSNFIEGLSELASFKKFNINPKRMIDQELVTRFVAFYTLGESNYRPRMDDFLEKALGELRYRDKNDINKIASGFDLAMKRAYDLFGNTAFKRKGGKINKALFDVWSVRLSKMSDNNFMRLLQNKYFREKYNNLLANDKFISVVSQSTGHRESVSERFLMIDNLIKECLI